MLYALFNGLQAFWTHDTVYFFMDFTLAKTPFVAAGLTALMALVWATTCALSAFKWRLLLGRAHARDPHHASDSATCIQAGRNGAHDADWPIAEVRDYSTPYLQLDAGATVPSRIF